MQVFLRIFTVKNVFTNQNNVVIFVTKCYNTRE